MVCYSSLIPVVPSIVLMPIDPEVIAVWNRSSSIKLTEHISVDKQMIVLFVFANFKHQTTSGVQITSRYS